MMIIGLTWLKDFTSNGLGDELKGLNQVITFTTIKMMIYHHYTYKDTLVHKCGGGMQIALQLICFWGQTTLQQIFLTAKVANIQIYCKEREHTHTYKKAYHFYQRKLRSIACHAESHLSAKISNKICCRIFFFERRWINYCYKYQHQHGTFITEG